MLKVTKIKKNHKRALMARMKNDLIHVVDRMKKGSTDWN